VVSDISRVHPWNNANTVVIDGFKYLDSQEISSTFDMIELNKRFQVEQTTLANLGCDNITLIIDSVNTLFGLSGSTNIFLFLKKLSALVSGKLVLILHGDVFVSEVSSSLSLLKKNLDYLCGSYMTISNHTKKLEMDINFIDDPVYLEFYPGANKPNSFLIDLVHQQPSGSLARELAVMRIQFESEDCSFEFSPYSDPSKDDTHIHENFTKQNIIENQFNADTSVDPITSGLSQVSFNLHLTDKQKKAKDDLVLPYLSGATNNPVGTIHYHPDDRDDFDEDDPDDDLEI